MPRAPAERSLAWGGGAIEKTWTGLTKTGTEGVERLNALGIIPDLSHVSDVTSLDVLRVSKRPVILSHGAARALVNNARCASDEVIKGVAKSGGAVGPNQSNIGTQAATRKPGLSAEEYIRESIVNPNALVVQGYQAGVMPATSKETMPAESSRDRGVARVT